MPGRNSDRSPRCRLLEAAAELLTGAGATNGQFTVTITCPGSLLTFTPQSEELARPELPAGLSPMEKLILYAATREPQCAKKLAAKLDRKPHGGFREALRSLTRKGLLADGPDGYRLLE